MLLAKYAIFTHFLSYYPKLLEKGKKNSRFFLTFLFFISNLNLFIFLPPP